MGGSPLNRLSWLRSSAPFLNAAVDSPTTRWILFNAGQPLIVTSSKTIAQLPTEHVRLLLGASPYFGQGQHEGELVPADSDDHVLEAARHRGAPLVFLGLHEPQEDGGHGSGALPTSEFTDADKAVSNIKGTLYFSLEVSELPQADVENVVASQEGLAFTEPRAAAATLDPFAAAVFAEARSMVDWNTRNKVIKENHAILSHTHFDWCPSHMWSYSLHLVLPSMWIADLLVMGRLEVLLLDATALGGQHR
jgi:NAD+ diphosphatase